MYGGNACAAQINQLIFRGTKKYQSSNQTRLESLNNLKLTPSSTDRSGHGSFRDTRRSRSPESHGWQCPSPNYARLVCITTDSSCFGGHFVRTYVNYQPWVDWLPSQQRRRLAHWWDSALFLIPMALCF